MEGIIHLTDGSLLVIVPLGLEERTLAFLKETEPERVHTRLIHEGHTKKPMEVMVLHSWDPSEMPSVEELEDH